MNKEVKKLRSMINLPSDGHTSKEKHTANIHWSLESSLREKGTPFLNDEAAMLLVSMLRKFLVPIESVPFHEIFCFKDLASLKSALIGDQRRVIQDDLLKFDRYLQSTSCSKREFFLSSSTHDSAIMYSLAQEYGDLINLHDWYHSFKTKVLLPSPKAKRRVQHSPTSKKRKSTSQDDEDSKMIELLWSLTGAIQSKVLQSSDRASNHRSSSDAKQEKTRFLTENCL